MGTSQSKGRIISTENTASQPREPPYPGPSVEYFFLNTDVCMSTRMQLFANNMVTTDIDNYYPLLARKYAEGFKMLTFYRIPGVAKRQGSVFSTNPTISSPFQGIFCRYPAAPSQEQWQLKIEKSMIVTQRMHQGIISFSSTQGQVSDTSHLYQAITNNTQNGGRLVCVEMTGGMQGQGFGATMQGISPVMGVDLFFEIPVTPNREIYFYQCVPIPIQVEQSMSFGTSGIRVNCDWNGHLSTYLGQGWRLVEIFMDMGLQSQMHGFSATSLLNAVWFFEKPASRMEDNTPVYQGMFVDHWIKVVAGFTGTHSNTDWEPVIQQFGNQGWEFTCFLETPEVKMAGIGKVCRKVMMFFQRQILPPVGFVATPPASKAQGMPPVPGSDFLYTQEPPPAYEEATGQ